MKDLHPDAVGMSEFPVLKNGIENRRWGHRRLAETRPR